jgi:DNA-binding transcriptional LysR family regulator
MVELSHFRYFIAVAEELHFGRAAARLNMAQPPLTRQIKLLEERLGCRLFERNSRSTRLTDAGAQLLERARAVVAEADRAVQATRRLGRGEEGQLTLATAPSLMLGPLPRMIRTFRARYPRVEFRLNEMASSVILESVRAGAADLGLIRGTDKDAEIQTHLRWKEAMVAILPPAHPAAAESTMPAGRLRHEPFVFFPRHLGPSFYDEVIGYCRRAGYVPQVAQEARQWSSILSLVSAGMGVSIGPAPVAALMPKAVRCIPLQGFETTARLVGRAAGSNPAAAKFVAIARRERYN